MGPLPPLLLGLALQATWPARADVPEDRSVRLGERGAAPVVAGKRVALVVGNGRYAHTTQLAGAKRDAKLVAGALGALGFEVIEAIHADQRQLEVAVADFGAALAGAEVGFFYYAGHGLQVDGVNYMVPVDADLASERYVSAYTVTVDKVLAQMEGAGSALNIVVLDACRNNPFASQWSDSGRSAGAAGLASLMAPRGFIVGYATSPDRVAADDGAYALALADQLQRPGNEINDVFAWVYQAVVDHSEGAQVPWFTQARGPQRYFPAGAGSDAVAVVASTADLADRPTPAPADTRRSLRGTKVVYARELVTRNQVIEPIHLVRRQDQQHRARTWRVHLRKGRVVRAELINGHGAPVEDEESVHRYDQQWDADGNLVSHTTYDRLGRFVERTTFSEDFALRRWTDRHGRPKRLPAGDGDQLTEVSGERHTVDAQGFVLRSVNVNAHGMPRPNAQGVVAWDTVVDAHGDFVEAQALDASLQPRPDHDGVWAWQYQRDEQGELIVMQSVDREGRPYARPTGAAGWRYERDAFGNELSRTSVDAQGRPVSDRGNPARRECTLDDWGDPVACAYYGPHGQPVVGSTGEHSFRYQRDDRGNIVEARFFGIDGEPVAVSDWYHAKRSTYDARDLLLTSRYFDVEDLPTPSRGGRHGVAMTYDEAGNQTAYCTTGPDGALVLGPEGYACDHSAFDAHGNLVRTWYTGPDGERLPDEDGVAGWVGSFDPYGNCERFTYIDLMDRPSPGSEGWATVIKTFDHMGNPLSLTWLDTAGQPLDGAAGYAREERNYDVHGNLVEARYFRGDGSPAILAGGQHGWRATYDGRGRLVEKAWFDAAGRPSPERNGVAIERRAYDERGNHVETRFFGPDGQPVLHADGNHGVADAHDARGELVERRFFGLDDQPVSTPSGTARVLIRHVPGAGGGEFWLRLGLDGQPVNLDADGFVVVPEEIGLAATGEVAPGMHRANLLRQPSPTARGVWSELRAGDLLIDLLCTAGCPADWTMDQGPIDGSTLRLAVLRPDGEGYRLAHLEGPVGSFDGDLYYGPIVLRGDPTRAALAWWEADPARRPTELDFEVVKLAVATAIEQLPDAERRFVKLHYFQGHTVVEAAAAQGVAEKDAAALHARALEQLFQQLVARLGGMDGAGSDKLPPAIQPLFSVGAHAAHVALARQAGLPIPTRTVYLQNPPSPAVKALGLAWWDVIEGLNGTAPTSADQVLEALASASPAVPVTLQVLRLQGEERGRRFERQVTTPVPDLDLGEASP